MSTAVATPAESGPAQQQSATGAGRPRVTQLRVIHSEWIKLWSLRSTYISLILAAAFTIGLGVLISYLHANAIHHHRFERADLSDPTNITLSGVNLAQLVVGILGVMVITGEYSTGMIRASVVAVPRRLPLLWAKVAVFGVVVFVFGYLTSLLAFLGGASQLDGLHVPTINPNGPNVVINGVVNNGASHTLHLSLSTPGAARAILGAALFLTIVGLLGVGLGFCLRRTPGAIAALFGLLLILLPLVRALPANWQNDINKYLPELAGTQGFATVRDHSMLGPWTGLGVFALYALAAIVLGTVVLKERDA